MCDIVFLLPWIENLFWPMVNIKSFNAETFIIDFNIIYDF